MAFVDSAVGQPLCLRFRTDASDDRRLRDASFRYRVLTRLPLVSCGVPGFTEIVPMAGVSDEDDGVTAVLWQRPSEPVQVARLQRASRARLWVADLDDLLFAQPMHSPAVRTRRTTMGEAVQACNRYHQALSLFRHVTVSTAPLADAVTAAFPGTKVGLVLNGVPENWRRHGRLLYPPWKPGDARVLRYLSGTSSHEADFAVVGPTIARLLERHADISLEVVGPLHFDLDQFPAGRVRHLPAVPYQHLPHYLSSAWATIAPLEDNAFNRCKSSIKFMEAAAFGCPCVATPIPDMQRHAGKGVLFAITAEEWLAQLEALLDDEFRMDLSARARAHVDAECTEAQGTRALVSHLRDWLS